VINAAFILGAIDSKYPRAVMVPELSINDPYWHDWDHRPSPDKRLDGHKPIRRIDALMFDSYQRAAIEVKISAADYSLDTHQKRRPWQRVTHRFIYAVPHHLRVMAPHGCGLWKIHDDGSIEVVKKAIINRHPEPLPQDVVLRMAYRAAGKKFPEYNL
jgi:hypothetical protein